MKIGVVTHDKECSLILQRCLPLRNYQATILHNYDQAKTYLEQNTLDLLIVDITQEGSGIFLKLMQNGFPNLPLIALSNDNTPASIDKALDAGVKQYVITPFDLTDIMNRVQKLLTNNEKEKQA